MFLLTTLIIAITTRIGLPPDESYHLGFIRLFTENGLNPILSDQEGYYYLGEVVRVPYFLYHYLLSLPNHLLVNFDGSVYMLRLINIVLGASSLLVLHKIAKKLKFSDYVANLSLFMAVSTIMFTFVSAAINYDNLFIFLSLFCVLQLLAIINHPKTQNLILFIIGLLAGLLTKKTFIVVALVLTAVLIFRLVGDKKISKFSIAYKSIFTNLKPIYIGGLVLIALLIGLIAQRYVLNFAKYQSIDPSCTQVWAIDKCRESALFRRSELLDSTLRPEATRSTMEYVGGWLLLMGERTYGIHAHESYIPNQYVFGSVLLILVMGFLALVRKFNSKEKDVNTVLFIALAYGIVLVIENQIRYNKYGSFDFAVQGRYGLFSLLLIYPLLVYYLQKTLVTKNRLAVLAIIVTVVFFLAGLPSYAVLSASSWRNYTTQQQLENWPDFISN